MNIKPPVMNSEWERERESSGKGLYEGAERSSLFNLGLLEGISILNRKKK